ncbi:MAG: YbdD/YjiX family protein [Cellulomonas sp.]|uniref:YbdD/YjiX family protein n=1 Tax=Cellulomonas sp. TaxID=40001 RepID=UPI0019EA4910|nr:YbdD/YjiX family protein [Cellulomonas sp.]MBF0687130.1 YbdD/YjiX family protein [Cellulomonas sp.]
MSATADDAGRDRIALSRVRGVRWIALSRVWGVRWIALSRVWGVGRGVRWYVRELTGEAAYDRYAAAHARSHPAHAPLTRAQWWRARDDARESMAHERCC